MKKAIALLLMFLIMLSVVICGCSTQNDEITKQLIGKWEYNWYAGTVGKDCSIQFEFNGNGECIRIDDNALQKTSKGKYIVDKDYKEIVIEYDDGTDTLKYEVSGNTITSVTYSGDELTKK